MTYLPESGQVEYQSKDGNDTKVFDALEWLAAMCSHVPNKGEQIARYYGYYSNVSLGKRKKSGAEGCGMYAIIGKITPNRYLQFYYTCSRTDYIDRDLLIYFYCLKN